MRCADFDALVHEIGELCELLLDVAFGPAAIDHEHRPRLPRFGDGDGGEAWPRRLRRATMSERPEAVDRPGAFGEGVFDAESVEDVGGVGVREGEFPIVVAGQGVEAWPLAFKRVKLTDIGGLLFRRACGSATGGKRGGDLSVPARGRQPPKAPIWAVAAFFSTWASAGAS